MNRIPDKRFSSVMLFVEERYQKRVAAQFADDKRIKFHWNNPSHVRFEGRYEEICHLRQHVSTAAAELAERETIYSLPHSIVLKLKRSVLADIRRAHDVNFTVMRHKANGDDMMLLAVEGTPADRCAASDVLEQVVDRLKSHSTELPSAAAMMMEAEALGSAVEKDDGVSVRESASAARARRSSKREDSIIHPSALRESVSDMYNVFQGVVLYMDPRMREMMSDYQSRLDAIAAETQTNIYLGNRDLFWLNNYQLGIEGSERAVSAARQHVDLLMNQLKAMTTTLVLPQNVNEEIAKESKQLASSIHKQLGVDTVIIAQHGHIYVHLIGTHVQVAAAATIIDSRTNRIEKKSGDEAERLKRRDRIRNMNFAAEGIGGLDDTLRDMMRRTFESRLISPRLRKELGLQHVRGVLCYGPPGTGKTLIARKISSILGCEDPKIVNGPEVESKWVGEAEKNIRALFEEAEQEFEEKGEESNLHVIIFDEIDAIAKKRGGAHAKSRDGALNQLLCCLDGVESIDNVIVFGLTNRKDTLDPALLRAGRLEAHLEIGLPDAQGREDILKIHTQTMAENGRLDPGVNLRTLADFAEDFSGADLAGLVRSAVSFALEEIDDEDEVIITQELLQRGLHEVRFAKERMPDDEDPESSGPGLLQA
jgi:ATP-dependent 26S proteasome regulatory subunit